MLLHRINPEKNEARYYRVEVRPCISSFYAVHRVWGRIGRRRSGFLIMPCGSAEEAKVLAEKVARRKLKRGYIAVEEDDIH
jgi:predicted DNA-binding WGR domain protein